MNTIKIETTKDNALSLLGLLSIIEMDYKKSENTEILNVIEEIKNDVRNAVAKSENKI